MMVRTASMVFLLLAQISNFAYGLPTNKISIEIKLTEEDGKVYDNYTSREQKKEFEEALKDNIHVKRAFEGMQEIANWIPTNLGKNFLLSGTFDRQNIDNLESNVIYLEVLCHWQAWGQVYQECALEEVDVMRSFFNDYQNLQIQIKGACSEPEALRPRNSKRLIERDSS